MTEKQSLVRRFAGGVAEFARGVGEISRNNESGINTTGRQLGRIAGKTGRALKGVAQNMERGLVQPPPPMKTRIVDEPERRRKKKRQRPETHIHIHLDGENSLADVQEEEAEKDEKPSTSLWDDEARRIWD